MYPIIIMFAAYVLMAFGVWVSVTAHFQLTVANTVNFDTTKEDKERMLRSCWHKLVLAMVLTAAAMVAFVLVIVLSIPKDYVMFRALVVTGPLVCVVIFGILHHVTTHMAHAMKKLKNT